MVYEIDPDAKPDSEFDPGSLRHLAPGNTGRLLDARRTPIVITSVAPAKGAFVVEIGAFEDAGARWELPLEDVARFQFARDSRSAAPDEMAALEAARARFGRELVIECDEGARAQTQTRVAAERGAARAMLARAGHDTPDLRAMIARRAGEPASFEQLDAFLAARGVAELDEKLSHVFVSNPASEEVVKGHAIVLAELGLCPYRGPVVRNPELFAGGWSKELRAEHLIARMAFSQELWSSWGCEAVTLYRGAAVEGSWPARPPSSFVSATFSVEVAESHFNGGPATRTAALWRQEVPVTRLLMTFLETRAMNERFREAEAVLIGDPENGAF